MVATFVIRSAGDRATLLGRIANPSALLTEIGSRGLGESKRAFEDQKLGSTLWPERYPAQAEPFINVGPVIQRAGDGRKPTTDDFRRRPALGGSGSELAKSLAFKVSGDSVEWGSSRSELKPGLFNFGGRGSIPITGTTRKTLADWLSDKKARKIKSPGPGDTVQANPRSAYAKKLFFVFEKGRSEFSQRAYPRPFVGVTDEFAPQLVELTERYIATGKVK